MMKAKVRVSAVTPDQYGVSERLYFSAVSRSDGYPVDGTDENNNYARWTPSASFDMHVQNPALLGKFTIGQEFYVDFTEVDK